MKKEMKLPEEIIKLFKLAKDIQPNSQAAVRSDLLNNLLLKRHPSSCRAPLKGINNPNFAS